jgi:hypothetical protein
MGARRCTHQKFAPEFAGFYSIGSKLLIYDGDLHIYIPRPTEGPAPFHIFWLVTKPICFLLVIYILNRMKIFTILIVLLGLWHSHAMVTPNPGHKSNVGVYSWNRTRCISNMSYLGRVT